MSSGDDVVEGVGPDAAQLRDRCGAYLLIGGEHLLRRVTQQRRLVAAVLGTPKADLPGLPGAHC